MTLCCFPVAIFFSLFSFLLSVLLVSIPFLHHPPPLPLEKEMATHSSILAQRILWTEEPGGLLSVGFHRVGHDWSDLACMHALEKEMATHSSILAWIILGTGEPGGLPSMGSHSQTLLKQLSSSSSSTPVFPSWTFWGVWHLKPSLLDQKTSLNTFW